MSFLVILVASGVAHEVSVVAAEPAGVTQAADVAPMVERGKPAPPLHLLTLLQAPTDAPKTLDRLRGKAVVLEFWFTACGPCVAAFPHLNDVVKETRDEPVVFIAITDEPAERVATFLKNKTLTTWVGVDDKGTTTGGYGITKFPTTVLIDPDGVVRGVTSPENITTGLIKDLANRRPLALKEDASPRMRIAATGGMDLGSADILVYIGEPNNQLGNPMGSVNESKSRCCDAKTLLLMCYREEASASGSAPRVVLECDTPKKDFGYAVRVPKGSAFRKEALLKPAVEAALGFRTSGKHESREMDVFVLRHVGPASPAKAVGDPALGSRVMWPPKAIIGEGSPIKDLAQWIERETKTPVVDETGLSDRYDWQLKLKSFAADDVNEALKKMGLAITRDRRKLDYIVVRRLGESGQK
jgi:thiol-disulfide isomerase/thioredoxin